MPKYVIEREIPGAGKLSKQELQAISQKSCGVLRNLGPQVQWLHSYVTDDKVYCVYIAPNEAAVLEHELGDDVHVAQLVEHFHIGARACLGLLDDLQIEPVEEKTICRILLLRIASSTL